jgi:DNA-directed RNA polymerase subunit RPC12/RpoP
MTMCVRCKRELEEDVGVFIRDEDGELHSVGRYQAFVCANCLRENEAEARQYGFKLDPEWVEWYEEEPSEPTYVVIRTDDVLSPRFRPSGWEPQEPEEEH